MAANILTKAELDAIVANATGFATTAEVASAISDFNAEEVADNSAILQFDGFNPLITFRVVNALIAKDQGVRAHLHTMIAFGLMRGFGGGKSWSSILSKTRPEGRNTLSSAKDALGVKLSAPSASTDITISRLMSAFPVNTYLLYCQLRKKNLLLVQVQNFGNLPPRLQWLGSPVCMSDSVWNEQRENYVNFSIAHSTLWNQTQSRETASKFASLAYGSTVWPAANRLNKALADAALSSAEVIPGIITGNGSPST